MLTIDSVVKVYEAGGGGVRALDDVTVAVPRGQMVGVIGRSGAGKSTLLRMINRLVEPSAGRIAFEGEDVTALRGRALFRWRSACAMIFQQFNLVSRLDVLTNVLLGRVADHGTLPSMFKLFTEEERAMAVDALERLDLLPQALQRAETLSGGQQQRVAIARALMQRPKVLLADEPIASLDPHNAMLVMDALRRINEEDGITVIANLHTIDTARTYCDRIVGLAAGKVVFDGLSDDLTPATVREIYGVLEAEEALDEGITSTSLKQHGAAHA
ncbi:MAG: phosphonate ABC transporter ATP-binding protein [Acetobacterales bacterium]